MIIYKCKMCGGNLNVPEGSKVVTCEYCRTQQTVPSTDDERRANLFNRANHFRQNSEFDKAISIYEHIIDEDGSDAEAYWSMALCKYGVEYVEDPGTGLRKPTINRTQKVSILADADYLMALEHADYVQRSLFEEEAAEIDRIQKEILKIANKEKPYDVFICYKEKNEVGDRTKSSVIAQNLYDKLTKEGFRVFFSRITLEDKIGQKYEPYIYSALLSSKVMLVIATNKDEYNAPWVKNEWNRFLVMKREDSQKVLIPCFAELDIDEMPNEFQILQGQDMSKLGFEQDLIRGIKKIIAKDNDTVEPVARASDFTVSLERILKNAETNVSMGNFDGAYDMFETVTKQFPEDYRGWWGLIICVSRNLTEIGNKSKKVHEWFNYVMKCASPDELEIVRKRYVEYLKLVSDNDADTEIQMANNTKSNQKSVLENALKEKKSAESALESQKSTCMSNVSDLRKQVDATNQNIETNKRKRMLSRVLIICAIVLAFIGYNIGNAVWQAGNEKAAESGFMKFLLIPLIMIVVGYFVGKNTYGRQKTSELEQQVSQYSKRIEDIEGNFKTQEANSNHIINELNKKIGDIQAEINILNSYLMLGKETISDLIFVGYKNRIGIIDQCDVKADDIRKKALTILGK